MALASYAAGFSQRGSLGKWAIMALVCLLVLAVLGGLKYRQIKEAIALRTEVGGKVAATGFVGGKVRPLTPG